METFSLGTKILAGKGAVSALAQLQPRRLLLVTDPYFTKNGTAQRIAREAGAQEFEIFDQVEPDPSVALAAKGVARLKAFGPDLVVALGGGSALDCAKAMVYFAGGCPLAAVPTTSGSGSEVTDFAILTHGGVKHPLVDEKLRPKLAILCRRDALRTRASMCWPMRWKPAAGNGLGPSPGALPGRPSPWPMKICPNPLPEIPRCGFPCIRLRPWRGWPSIRRGWESVMLGPMPWAGRTMCLTGG